MRKVLVATVLAGLMVLLADIAQAQRGGFGRFNTGGTALLQNKSVQEELKMTEEQKTKIGELAKDAQQKREDVVGKFDFKDKDSFAKVKEAMADPKNKEKLASIEQTHLKSALDLLKPEQQKRFKQIDRQVMGVEAFTKEEVIKELNLTDPQKEKIKAIVEEINKDRDELRKSGFTKGGDFKETQKKITALNKEGVDKAAAVLTDEQKTKWKDLVGEPFEVRFEGGGGGFGKKKKED